jgi:hypothetical protein
MSRSALWRQEDNVKERERKATVIYDNAVEEGRSNNHLKGVIPLIGPDDTFNLHPMLLNNIVNSAYFQKCCERLTDWNTLVDEIFYEVKHVEPWTAGESSVANYYTYIYIFYRRGLQCMCIVEFTAPQRGENPVWKNINPCYFSSLSSRAGKLYC